MVGRITSGMYGHTVGAPLGMGYVSSPDGPADPPFVLTGNYEVEVACERVPAEVSLKPFFDPASERVRS
jgi:4-methylaminobutanoate oxidase (formaldehyde-forming)